MSSSSSSSSAAADALLAWLQALPLPSFSNSNSVQRSSSQRSLNSIVDVCDGDALWEVLATLDSAYFRNPRPATHTPTPDNWVLHFNALKRLYKLVIQYFEDELQKSTLALTPTPNLPKMAKDHDQHEASSLCFLVLALATEVKADVHVPIITALDTWAQKELMLGLESIRSKLTSKQVEVSMFKDEDTTADDDFYNLQSERSRIIGENATLSHAYEELLGQFRSLQNEHDKTLMKLVTSEEALVVSNQNSERQRTTDRNDLILKNELDRVRSDLNKVEIELSESEQVIERQSKMLEDMNKKVEESSDKDDQVRKLKDQVDEYKHAADKLSKTENVIEKYKKKLEDSADLRRQMKTLEEQNSDLLDKHATLEDEYRKVSTFKPLMDQYKSQIVTLETQVSNGKREVEDLKHALRMAEERAIAAEEEREHVDEERTLFAERVKELETEGPKRTRRSTVTKITDGDDSQPWNHEEIEDEDEYGVGGELDDAMAGRTMTSLKLQLRKTRKDLEEALTNKADASRIVVLENLLEDSRKMKERYESDFLKEHRQLLVHKSQLEEIMSGKSKVGDGPEAAIALRQRLNETVDDLTKLQREHTEIQVKFEKANRDLTIAKSDLNLVNKDQLDILSSLRASVSIEKEGLEGDLERMKKSQSTLSQTNVMQMSQINKLLLEKIDLQSDSIGQREKAIEREREFRGFGSSSTTATTSMTSRSTVELEEEVKDLKERLTRARAFIRGQDELFKKSRPIGESTPAQYEEAEQSFKAEIIALKEANSRQKVLNEEMESRYQRELRLMSAAWHHLGQQRIRQGVAVSGGVGLSKTVAPQAWIGLQRKRAFGQNL